MTQVVLDASALIAMLRKLAALRRSLVDADGKLAWAAGRLRGATAEAGLSLGTASVLRSAPRTAF